LKRNRELFLLGIALVIFALLACDAGNLIAFVSPTSTPTRTPRPTFTPRPTVTPTPEDTPTPAPTATLVPSPTTRRPAATVRPATKAPTAPPAPQFEWKQASHGNQGRCPAGPGTFEIKGRISSPGEGYVGGITVVLLGKSGKVIGKTTSRYPIELNPEWGVSCFEEKNMFNYQLDASAGWFDGPLTLRLVRSATDLTPISTDVKITFDASGGRYYIDWERAR